MPPSALISGGYQRNRVNLGVVYDANHPSPYILLRGEETLFKTILFNEFLGTSGAGDIYARSS